MTGAWGKSSPTRITKVRLLLLRFAIVCRRTWRLVRYSGTQWSPDSHSVRIAELAERSRAKKTTMRAGRGGTYFGAVHHLLTSRFLHAGQPARLRPLSPSSDRRLLKSIKDATCQHHPGLLDCASHRLFGGTHMALTKRSYPSCSLRPSIHSTIANAPR